MAVTTTATRTDIRVYLLVEDLQRQFAAYLGTPTRARGYPPYEGEHALIVEVSPALAIERVIDLALREVPGVAPGILYVERQFGVLEVHSSDLSEVRRAGEAILQGTGAKAADQLRPRVLFHDIIEDITDQHAVILNRNRQASMILPGQALLVYEMTPALFAAVAANEAERAAPELTIVDVQMIGATGRLYIGGSTKDVTAARDRITAVLGRNRGTRPLMENSNGVIADDRGVAERALAEYGLSPNSGLHLLNLSENATYAVEDAATGDRSILRVHRQNYHLPHQIRSELDWLDALRGDSDITVPTVLLAADGRRVVTVNVNGTDRHVVHFAMVPGAEPDEETVTVDDFHTLGQITAALHEHSHAWARPGGFSRFSWDWTHSLGAEARWGRWQDADGVGADEHRLLGRAEQLLRERLESYGSGPDRFGLIHADLRLANLLVDGSTITVIDFDDCGFGWFFYDFGTAVSFIEDDPALPDWQDSWVAGYRTRRPIAAVDEDMLSSFVFLRRLMLLAWMGTHSHSKESRTKAITYAQGSCTLAERYLSSNGRRLA